MRIAIFLIVVSIQVSGIFSGVQAALANDLKVSFENEVAGITPGMTLLQKATGNLDQPGTLIAKSENANSVHSNRTNFSIPDSRSKLRRDPYASAGFISNKMVPVGKVSKVFDNKLATTGPERVFIDIGRRQGLELGDKFTAYSQERFIYHPVFGHNGIGFQLFKPRRTGFESKQYLSSSGKPLGYSIMIRGILEVVEIGETTSYANVIKSYEDIKPGELLIPYQENVEPMSDGGSDKNIDGYVVATKLDKIGVGVTDIVYIDQGWEGGVQAGDVFEVYNIPEIAEKKWWEFWRYKGTKKTPLLPDVLGEIKIVNTQRRTASAVIVQNNYDMHVGNKIRTKR
ncbi:MAG: hypothetical protein HOK41_10140 [Nitrospina sp.]|jgi:hypothetical protein|nr:hypothetical protein [Nitrospina sp.]MBT6718605.1 hypothetical protein [Nitrospina sp.]